MKSFFTKLKRKIKFQKRRRTGKRRYRVTRSPKKKFTNKHKIGAGGIRSCIVLFAITTLCISMFGWCTYCLYKLNTIGLKRAYKDEIDESERGQEWIGKERINILVIGMDKRNGEFGFIDGLAILTIEPQNHYMGLFSVNPDIVVHPVSCGKDVRLRNLYNLGVLEKTSAPVDLIKDEIEILLAVTIDRYIMLNEEGVIGLVDALGGVSVDNMSAFEDKDIYIEEKKFQLDSGTSHLGGEEFLGYLSAEDDGIENKFQRQMEGVTSFFVRGTGYRAFIGLPSFLDEISRSIYTDLSRKELMRLAFEISHLEESKLSFTTFSSLQKETKKGGGYYYPIFDSLDLDIQRVLTDRNVGREQARVEIFNSTNVKGLGSFKARCLKNIGIDVIRVGDSSSVLDKTTIFTREEGAYSDTIQAIESLFEGGIDLQDGVLPGWICTGDVILVLGKDNVEGM